MFPTAGLGLVANGSLTHCPAFVELWETFGAFGQAQLSSLRPDKHRGLQHVAWHLSAREACRGMLLLRPITWRVCFAGLGLAAGVLLRASGLCSRAIVHKSNQKCVARVGCCLESLIDPCNLTCRRRASTPEPSESRHIRASDSVAGHGLHGRDLRRLSS